MLGVYFAQARLYDAANKRFMQTDPIGGNVMRTISLNPYLYCSDDPLNYIDPTGMWQEGDENLSPEQQAAIQACTDAFYNATTPEGKAAAHAAAEAIRNSPPTGTGAPSTPGSSQSMHNSYTGQTLYYDAFTAMDILVDAIATSTVTTTSGGKVLASVYFDYSMWTAAISTIIPSATVALPNIMEYQPSLLPQGPPNQWVPQFGEDGELKQYRHYGPDGEADYDVDFRHGGVHAFPHGHPWPEGERSKEPDIPPNPPVPLPEDFEKGGNSKPDNGSDNSSSGSWGVGAVIVVGGGYAMVSIGGGGISTSLEAAAI